MNVDQEKHWLMFVLCLVLLCLKIHLDLVLCIFHHDFEFYQVISRDNLFVEIKHARISMNQNEMKEYLKVFLNFNKHDLGQKLKGAHFEHRDAVFTKRRDLQSLF